MPAEWEPHEATWIAWPHNATDWPGKFAPIPWVYGEIVRKLARVERVRILVQNAGARRRRRAAFSTKCGANLDAVEFFQRPTDRVWTRDYCPLFVKNRARRGRRSRTGASTRWAKYDDWQRDAARARRSSRERLKLPSFDAGHRARRRQHRRQRRGTLLTTEECLLSPVQARNPGISAARRSSARLRDYLGVDARDLAAATASPATTRTATSTTWRASSIRRRWCSRRRADPRDANYEPLRRTCDCCSAAGLQRGEAADAARRCTSTAQRLPASYANFYIANGLVLVPTFNDPNDRVALNIAGEAVPRSRGGRHQLHGPDLGPGHAALHDAAAAGVNQTAASSRW